MIYCPECGYDLRAIESERCPECGTSIDRATLSRSQIPWSHRGQIGVWRAYWRTIKFVLAKPTVLAREIARPVPFRDAAAFRWFTVAGILWNLVAVFFVWWALSHDRDAIYKQLRLGWPLPIPLGAWTVACAGAGVIIWLILITGCASYFFHPRSLEVVRQNRAIALGYYPVGILAAAMVWTDAALIGHLFTKSPIGARPTMPALFIGLAISLVDCFAVVLVLVFWWRTLLLLQRTTQCGPIRLAAAGLTLAACLASGPFLVGGISQAVAWLVVIFR